MNKITQHFINLWKSKEQTGASIPRFTVFFFDEFPGVPVVYLNYCQLARDEVGVIIHFKGEEKILHLGEKL
jgi:hypothetical protein